MPTEVNLHQLYDLADEQSQSEILLETNINTELHIIAKSDRTIIALPFGNKPEIIDGYIVIHEK